MDRVLRWGSLAGAVMAIVGVLTYFDLMPALSMDIKKLDRRQAETAIEVYSNKVRWWIITPRPADPIQQQIFDEELNKARRQLLEAEKRKIELTD